MDDIGNAIVHDTPMPPWPSIPPSATNACSNITANDNSRIRNSHSFYFHQYCTVQSHGNDFAESSSQLTLKRKRSLADIDANPRTRKAQESLDDVLKKLGKLSLSIRHRKEGDGAEKVARRVAAIFDAITTHGDEERWDKATARQLGQLGVTVKWEERFEVNSVPHRRSIGKIAKAKRRRIIVQVGHWDISLTTALDLTHESGLRETEKFSTLRVEPRHRSSGSALAVFFSKLTHGLSTSTIPPSVLAYNMVSDAQIQKAVRVIRGDNLDSLRRLLDAGELSLRDCTESGRPLFHIACDYDSVKCRSFLISRGVDIDKTEMIFDRVNKRYKHVAHELQD